MITASTMLNPDKAPNTRGETDKKREEPSKRGKRVVLRKKI